MKSKTTAAVKDFRNECKEIVNSDDYQHLKFKFSEPSHPLNT